ncbi:MAG: hypothetical protein AAGC85_22675, partial [Bacteroidota bacterium]
NGGIFHCMRISKLAKAQGVSLQLGAHFGETSLLTAAAMLFASLEPELTSMEGGLGTHLLSKDVVEHSLSVNQKGKIKNTGHLLQHGWGMNVLPLVEEIGLST